MPSQRTAALYTRVSTEDQGQGYSLQSQFEACRALAEKEGYTVSDTYVFSDEVSGATLDRPDLRQLRQAIANGNIAAVAVYDTDRLSRSLGHLLLLMEEYQTAGVAGRLLFQIQGSVAKFERAKMT